MGVFCLTALTIDYQGAVYAFVFWMIAIINLLLIDRVWRQPAPRGMRPRDWVQRAMALAAVAVVSGFVVALLPVFVGWLRDELGHRARPAMAEARP